MSFPDPTPDDLFPDLASPGPAQGLWGGPGGSSATPPSGRPHVPWPGRLGRIQRVMRGGEWMTVEAITLAIWRQLRTNDQEANISAELKMLARQTRPVDGFQVLVREEANGLREYQLVAVEEEPGEDDAVEVDLTD